MPNKELSTNDFTNGYKQKLDSLKNYDDTEIKNKDTEQDSKIEELQNQKTELEKELKEMQEDYYQTSIRGQASGEYIHVEDSSGARCKIGISGNSEQETRSGKNLLNFNGFATKAISGVTITNNNDGSITLNGTATATISIRLSNQMNKTLTAGNYYLSRNSKGSVSGAVTTFMFGNNGAEDINFATITEENKGFSTSIDYKKYWLWLYINSGITFTNYIMKPQLEAGTVKTNWELYGVSPSLHYPSEIKTVGDNVNLYDKDNEIVCNGIGIESSGELFSRSDQKLLIIPISQGKTNIAISFSKTFSHSLRYAFSNSIVENVNSEIFDADYVTDSTKTDVKVSKTITNNKYKYLLLSFIKSDNYPDLKIEYNSTPTSYSGYGQGSVKLTKCNDNIFDKDDKQIANNSGRYQMNGKTQYNVDYSYVELKYKKGEQLTFSGCDSASGTNVIIFNFYKDKTYLSQKMFSNTSGTISIPNDCNIFTFSFPMSDKNKIQLKPSITPSPYEEHQEQSYIIPVQQPFRAIGDTRDTFIKKDDKWHERHKVYRYIFTGDETFIHYMEGNINIFYTHNIINSIGEYPQCYSSYFIPANNYKELMSEIGKIAIKNDGHQIIISSNCTTPEELKEWINTRYNSTIPVYVDYILETPIDIECTEEQSKILDELNNARTYKNVTNITTDSIAILDLDYVKDLETLLTSKESEV